ncbi:MAG: hypothetical protein ABIG64_03395 [Candidatus Omnitrophota bacterium]
MLIKNFTRKRKILPVIIIFSVSSCFLINNSVVAAPINLPTAVMKENPEKKKPSKYELFFQLRGPQAKKSADIYGGSKILFSFLEERGTAVKGDSLIREIESQFYTIELLVSWAEYVDIYTEIGIADNMKFKVTEPGLKTTVEGKPDFLYGAGITLNTFSWGNGFRIFSDTRFRSTGKFELTSLENNPPLYSGGTLTSTMWNSQAEYKEWQTALALSKEFVFSNKSEKLVLFSGAVYSDVKASAKGTSFNSMEWPYFAVDWIIDYDFGSMRAENNIGGVAGLAFITNDAGKNYTAFNFQYRFIDELSFSFGIDYRF